MGCSERPVLLSAFPERTISPGQGAARGRSMPRRIILMPRSSQSISLLFPNGKPPPPFFLISHRPAP